MAAVLDRGDGRGGRPLGPERHQFQDGFTLGVHAERAADGGVDEARVETRRQPERTAHLQEVREQGPGVPEEVAVATRLILPRVPPVDRGEKNRRRAPAPWGPAARAARVSIGSGSTSRGSASGGSSV